MVPEVLPLENLMLRGNFLTSASAPKLLELVEAHDQLRSINLFCLSFLLLFLSLALSFFFFLFFFFLFFFFFLLLLQLSMFVPSSSSSPLCTANRLPRTFVDQLRRVLAAKRKGLLSLS